MSEMINMYNKHVKKSQFSKFFCCFLSNFDLSESSIKQNGKRIYFCRFSVKTKYWKKYLTILTSQVNSIISKMPGIDIQDKDT